MIDERLFPAAPPQRLAALRIVMGAAALIYVAIRSVGLVTAVGHPAWQFRGVGVLAWSSAPPTLASVIAALVVSVVGGGAFVLGWRHRVSAPLFAFALLWLLSFRNSWGMVFHTENLMVLHVVLLAIAPAADAWSLDARRRGDAVDGVARVRYGAPIRLLALVTVVTYAIAGVSKLRASGWRWVTGDTLRNLVAFDNLRKAELGDAYSALGVALVPYGAIFVGLAAVSLAVELGAPLALLHARVGRWWCAAAWGFHVGVVALMWIGFPYQLFGVAYAPFFSLEQPLARVAARWRDRSGSQRGRASERR